MARRRGFTTGFYDARTCHDDIRERTLDDTSTLQQFPAQEHTHSGKKGGYRKMPLTQEKLLDGNFTNNNDNSYLHKKFKKMATTISMSSSNPCKDNENINVDCNIVNTDSDTSISNGSIAASHPEIEKIKEKSGCTLFVSRQGYVQTTFNDKNNRLSDINNEQHNGKTSFSNEFSNKTENIDNDFIKDVSVGTSGRYICPYCKLSCAKPSVLQKHIRAHTNERPYPCVPCGFAFKTKSNLYKHRRSRTHALRLQGADVPVTNEDDLSGDSESDNSLPPTSASDAGSDVSTIRFEVVRPCEFSSPELLTDRNTPPTGTMLSSDGSFKSKTIYKPKFRAALYQEIEEKERNVKPLSANAEFLNEHISKIISDNEAIVDVIETPLQKKYGKIKQIAESKQLHQINQNNELKRESSPLNLTKSGEADSFFRKRSHSDTFSNIDYHKHPLNPEGSIIKDLLLKTKGNGLTSVTSEMVELTPLYICPLCQIPYRSADNLETHRLNYCKGNPNIQKEFVRSNSINVRLPESNSNSSHKPQTITRSPPLKSKPDNLILIKPESNDIATPLPSPGPLLGHTRLVDTRVSCDYSRKPDMKLMTSPKRRFESRSDNYSPRLTDNMSPRGMDSYSYSKLRCIESTSRNPRMNDDYSQSPLKQNASLQMFGGEVKIHQSGSTTTLRIEPSKNQLSPISGPGKNCETESSIVLRSGIHSGGTVSIQNQTPKMSIATSTLNLQSTSMHDMPHFQFPPLSAITAFNPLTLPPLSPSTPNGTTSILHGGKIIPHVPGMPGPNTAALFMGTSSNPLKITLNENSFDSKSDKKPSINSKTYKTSVRYEDAPRTSKITHGDSETYSIKNCVDKQPRITTVKVKRIEEISAVSPKIIISNAVRPSIITPMKRTIDGTQKPSILKESVNYTQNKSKTVERTNINKSLDIRTPEHEIRNFNFEIMITKAEIYNNQIPNSSDVSKSTTGPSEPNSSTILNERSETSYFQKNSSVNSGTDERKPKFLRPSTLALKPGTFTPKRHHGITPNANTMPLVSPETPRPAKAYGQLYLNGNAYTYLGLKCSTKVFYCTINRPQPTYVPNQHFLSMYSNWQLLSELTPDPLGLTTSLAMSLYDSRHRPQNTIVSKIKQDLILTHSSQWNKNSRDSKHLMMLENKRSEDKYQSSDEVAAPKKELAGGFESNEEYTYIRGRGRGRYVCSECGIRCKKPSMLKKHIRTHTDVRPFTCTHCAFSFKTKGNLTKHMKSKAHYKKCCELGINPSEGAELEGGDPQCSGETDDESDSDGDEGNEGETESSDTEMCKSRLPEHEAAHCLLSLGGSRPTTSGHPGLITSARPSTYPYTPVALEAAAQHSMEILVKTDLSEARTDDENEPMDLSKTDLKSPMPEIPTARESSVLASLASNTAKLPQQATQWSNGEPMLHAYLTERALLDSKIKQSQLTGSCLSKLRKDDKTGFSEGKNNLTFTTSGSREPIVTSVVAPNCIPKEQVFEPNQNLVSGNVIKPISKIETSNDISVMPTTNLIDKKVSTEGNAENVKFVVSEYLKLSRVNVSETSEGMSPAEYTAETSAKSNVDSKNEENQNDSDSTKSSLMDHEPVARKVVIGAGGVAFKVTKGKDYEGNMASYAPGRLMEDGRRVCDFCNKTFTKPSQLRLHLNIHYMERPFRCSACAVSFRTRGHLQKHERSGSHHNKVSMTSTFGAATSLNPRPFRCSDCNIAFRIHGHLAKHLRSKMHVMRLECLYKLPFGTFTEIERAGVSLTDIDTTDCASSLASLQMLARKLHEMDPSKLEYREPSSAPATSAAPCKDSSDDEDTMTLLHAERLSESEKDKSDNKTVENSHEEM